MENQFPLLYEFYKISEHTEQNYTKLDLKISRGQIVDVIDYIWALGDQHGKHVSSVARLAYCRMKANPEITKFVANNGQIVTFAS